MYVSGRHDRFPILLPQIIDLFIDRADLICIFPHMPLDLLMSSTVDWIMISLIISDKEHIICNRLDLQIIIIVHQLGDPLRTFPA